MFREGIGLKDHVEMWVRFAESTMGWGYHISNARLYVLGQMIEHRVQHSGWDEERYHASMRHILLLIGYAKEATANEKKIYLFAIVEWLKEIIETINEEESREKREREYRHQRLMDEANDIANQVPPEDTLLDE